MERRFAIHAVAIGLALAALLPTSGFGDVFLLKSGGQVEGQWTSRDERRSSGTELKTASGIVIRLPAEAVAARVPLKEAEAEYERIAPTYPNTVEAQWELATWCRDQNLPHRRKQHLEAILELDPDYVAARRTLGYQQFRGKWQTSEQFHRKEGYEMYRGRWHLVQDIEIQEEKAKRNLAEKQWYMTLKRWRADLASERALLALERFDELRDPQAVPALRALIANEPNRRVKVIYLDALMQIGDGNAVSTMITTAMNDKDEEVFFETADRLKKLPVQITAKPLIDSLRDPDNIKVNRAAYLLGKLGDEQVVSPLIDALITMHRVKVNQPGGDTTSSFTGDGNFQMAKGGPQVVDVALQNQYVLESLIELTGQNFDFDQRAWRRWYNIEKTRIFAKNPTADLRREDSSRSQ